MKKPEQIFYHDVIKPMLDKTPNTDHKRVENKIGDGTPDVLWAHRAERGSDYIRQFGWLELKVSTVNGAAGNVNLSHFTGQQKNWLTWGNHLGGNCYLCLKVDDFLMLIPAPRAETLGSNVTFESLKEISSRVWSLQIGVHHNSFLDGLLFGETDYARDNTLELH